MCLYSHIRCHKYNINTIKAEASSCQQQKPQSINTSLQSRSRSSHTINNNNSCIQTQPPQYQEIQQLQSINTSLQSTSSHTLNNNNNSWTQTQAPSHSQWIQTNISKIQQILPGIDTIPGGTNLIQDFLSDC